MKFITPLAAAMLLTAPAQAAPFIHHGTYHGPNGAYTKCTVTGSMYSSSAHCLSGDEAREEDRKLKGKNTCLANLDATWDANNPMHMSKPDRSGNRHIQTKRVLGCSHLGLN